MSTAHAILFTNLDYILIGDVQANVRALVLEADYGVRGATPPRYKARAFGPSASWPVFQIAIPTTDHQLDPIQDRAFLIITNGPTLTLIKTVNGDQRLPICVDTFQANATNVIDYAEVWAALERRVYEFWTGPNMPHLVWGPR